MIDWQQIDTVFLDMDGTLLDLHFDNYFWLAHLPQHYASHHTISLEEATQRLETLYQAQEGTLNWYCVDFWTETLGLNIPQLKEDLVHLIAFRPHVEHFLEELKQTRHRVVLVTNAHHKSLNIKLRVTRLDHFVDQIICTHDIGLPKENVQFWEALQHIEPFDPARTLFIDDSISVLNSARAYGIKHLFTILQPDSTGPRRSDLGYQAIDEFRELIRKP